RESRMVKIRASRSVMMGWWASKCMGRMVGGSDGVTKWKSATKGVGGGVVDMDGRVAGRSEYPFGAWHEVFPQAVSPGPGRGVVAGFGESGAGAGRARCAERRHTEQKQKQRRSGGADRLGRFQGWAAGG